MKVKKILIGICSVALIIMLCVCNAMLLNPQQLIIREETISSIKIDSSFDDYIIAYFSDLNYGGGTDQEGLDNLVDKINDINPDVVIFGGDLIYSLGQGSEDLTNSLKRITAKNTKYAVLGDQDNESAKEILTNSDFVILDNKNVQLYSNSGSYINLVGLSTDANVSEANAGITSGYSLVVTHYPDNSTSINSADYILAGHSLGGRIYIPLISMFNTIDGAHKYYRGKHTVNGATLDISSGVGTKEKSARFLADAELVFYKIKAN